MELTNWYCRSSDRIVLDGGEGSILSVTKTDDGFKFMEECDSCFSETYTKEEAIKVIDELRAWIEAQQ